MTVAHLRPLAEDDLVERTRYYSAEGGTDLALRFFDAAVASLRADAQDLPVILSDLDPERE